MSVGLRMDRQSVTAVFWLTRESGRVPVCVDATLCGCCVTKRKPEELRSAYLAVVEREHCLRTRHPDRVSVLTVMAFRATWRSWSRVERKKALVEQHVRLCAGAWAGEPHCTGRWCGEGGDGTSCMECTVEDSLFAPKYEGVFPRGEDHWWTGVTDSIDGGREALDTVWLKCWMWRWVTMCDEELGSTPYCTIRKRISVPKFLWLGSSGGVSAALVVD